MGMTVVQTRRRNSLQKEENSLLIENENSNLKRARKSEGVRRYVWLQFIAESFGYGYM